MLLGVENVAKRTVVMWACMIRDSFPFLCCCGRSAYDTNRIDFYSENKRWISF